MQSTSIRGEQIMKNNKTNEQVIDYLAEEEKREEALRARRESRKAGKHQRIEKMLTGLKAMGASAGR